MSRARRLFALFLGLIVASLSPAQAATVPLDGDAAMRELGPFSKQLADPTGEMSTQDAKAALADGRFNPIEGSHFDAGYSITPHWIAIPVENVSERPVAHIVSTNIPYVVALKVVLLKDGNATEPLLDKTPETPWRMDQFLGQSVISEQFVLGPGEAATLLARFQPYGIGVLPLSIETPLTATDLSATNTQTLFAFYGYALTSLALLFMFVLALWHPGGLNFLALFVCGLVMMAQLDGLFNEWVWPGWPEWNKVASFPMLLALCSAGFMTSAFMLRTGDVPGLARIGRKLAFACFLPLLLVPWIEVAWLILVGFVFMVCAVALLAYAVTNWAQLLPGKTRIALVLGWSIFAAVGFILTDVLIGRGNLSSQSLSLVKILYLILTLIIMVSYATHVAALNREHAVALKRELDFAQNEARISADLLESERRYARARDLVTQQRHRLANASHDLRQPIASLRMTLDSITRKADGSVDETVVRAFDYLDDLVSNHLAETRDEEPDAQTAETQSESEDIAASLITQTVLEMFSEEAAAKGLRLKHVDSSAILRVPPMPVMRIVSNLVSNAVKYTETGGVLFGARPRGSDVAIEVVDTGSGMDDAALRALSERYRKGAASDGEGLGLSICFDLAAQHGFSLTAESTLGRGTRFILRVPRAAEA